MPANEGNDVVQGRPKWRQVLDDLEDRLASGDITDRFPTDRELVEHYGVSRHTVREAVRRLRARGIISRERGRGSYVHGDVLEQTAGTLYSLFREVERRGQEQTSAVLELRHCQHAETAQRLDLAPDAALVVLARLRFADDRPLAMDTVWLPADVGEPLLDVDMRRTALYDELERLGTAVDEAEERVEVVVPDGDLAELLELDRDEGVFRIARRGLSDGRPVEWRVTFVRGDRFAFVSRWQRDGVPTPARFEPS